MIALLIALSPAALAAPPANGDACDEAYVQQLEDSLVALSQQLGQLQRLMEQMSPMVGQGASSQAPIATVEAAFISKPYGIPVLIDGVGMGTTPITVGLSPGEHTITFLDDTGVTQTVEVLPGEKNRWKYSRVDRSIR